MNTPPTAALKICGVRDAEGLMAVRQSCARYVGFNFFPGSPRYLTPGKARELWPSPDTTGLQGVAIFVDPEQALLAEVAREVPAISIWQLHGQESPEFVRDVKQRYPEMTIWKAIPVTMLEDVRAAERYSDVCDLILFDGAVAGTGSAFPHAWLASFTPRTQIGIAGGIKVSNIKSTLQWQPQLIDVCSGAESEPGVKDPKKIQDLCRALDECGSLRS